MVACGEEVRSGRRPQQLLRDFTSISLRVKKKHDHLPSSTSCIFLKKKVLCHKQEHAIFELTINAGHKVTLAHPLPEPFLTLSNPQPRTTTTTTQQPRTLALVENFLQHHHYYHHHHHILHHRFISHTICLVALR